MRKLATTPLHFPTPLHFHLRGLTSSLRHNCQACLDRCMASLIVEIPEQSARADWMSWRNARILILLALVLRLIYLRWFTPYELVGDEAYYWVLAQRVTKYRLAQGDSPADARLYARFNTLGKIAEGLGLLKFQINKLFGRYKIIEYK